MIMAGRPAPVKYFPTNNRTLANLYEGMCVGSKTYLKPESISSDFSMFKQSVGEACGTVEALEEAAKICGIEAPFPFEEWRKRLDDFAEGHNRLCASLYAGIAGYDEEELLAKGSAVRQKCYVVVRDSYLGPPFGENCLRRLCENKDWKDRGEILEAHIGIWEFFPIPKWNPWPEGTPEFGLRSNREKQHAWKETLEVLRKEIPFPTKVDILGELERLTAQEPASKDFPSAERNIK